MGIIKAGEQVMAWISEVNSDKFFSHGVILE